MVSEKRKLYQQVDRLRTKWGYTPRQRFDIIQLTSSSERISVEYHAFKTLGLCGVAMVGEKKDSILLNSKRSTIEQNFDCGHELMHLYLHRHCADSFNCFMHSKPQQNTFLEWQANEGSAQLLVPYQDFIPRFWDSLKDSKILGLHNIHRAYPKIKESVV